MTIQLISFESVQLNWNFLSPEQIQILQTEEIITTQIEHNTNLSGRGALYAGSVQARKVWVHIATNAIIAPASDWGSCLVLNDHVYAALGTGISISPQAQTLLATVNGGVMPDILPPGAPILMP